MAELPEPSRKDIELTEVLAALGDPQRLAMVRELHELGDAPCGTLYADMPKSTRSHHLKALRVAGVTKAETIGTVRRLSLRYECLDARFPGLLDSILGLRRRKH